MHFFFSSQTNPFYQRIVKKSKREWSINPHGKSPISILHEYIQICLKQQPTYEYEEMADSSATPFK